MKWWPFSRNGKGEVPNVECCEGEDGCEGAEAEYLESLPACIRNDKDRLRRARKLDQQEREAHKLFDSQVIQFRKIRTRLAEEKK